MENGERPKLSAPTRKPRKSRQKYEKEQARDGHDNPAQQTQQREAKKGQRKLMTEKMNLPDHRQKTRVLQPITPFFETQRAWSGAAATKWEPRKPRKKTKGNTRKEISHRCTQIDTDDFRALSFVFFASFVVPSSSARLPRGGLKIFAGSRFSLIAVQSNWRGHEPQPTPTPRNSLTQRRKGAKNQNGRTTGLDSFASLCLCASPQFLFVSFVSFRPRQTVQIRQICG